MDPPTPEERYDAHRSHIVIQKGHVPPHDLGMIFALRAMIANLEMKVDVLTDELRRMQQQTGQRR